MPSHVEHMERTFNVLALLTNNRIFFFLSVSITLSITCVCLFIKRNFSLRIHTADVISL